MKFQTNVSYLQFSYKIYAISIFNLEFKLKLYLIVINQNFFGVISNCNHKVLFLLSHKLILISILLSAIVK